MAAIVNNLTVLAVADLDVSRSFYLDKLGFEEYFRTDGWSFLRRGTLLLRVGHCPGIEPISQFADHSLVIQAVVDDAQALYEEFNTRGTDSGRTRRQAVGATRVCRRHARRASAPLHADAVNL